MLAKKKAVFKGLDAQLKDAAKEQVLAQAVNNASESNELILKMEVRRLLKPCKRVIDLRGKVEGECDFYEVDGINHCMDEVAKDVFDQQIKLYGSYTMGVYEAVHQTENNFRVRYEKEISQVIEQGRPGVQKQERSTRKVIESKPEVSFTVPSYCFADIDRRKEERMNFYCSIDLSTAENVFVEAKSLDLSLHGIRIKTESDMALEVGEKFGIYFSGLKQQYVLDDVNGEQYEVVNISYKENERHIGLKRVEVHEFDKVSNFLRELIRSLKPVRKVNISNSLRALHIKGYEQYFTGSTKTFPIFLHQKDGLIEPKFALFNDVSEKSLHYWSNSNWEICLNGLLSEERLIVGMETEKPFYIYVFNTQSNGDVVYYSATDFELTRNKMLRSSFFAYGARQISWRVYKVQISPIDKEMCYRPLTTPAGKKEAEKNKIPIAAQAMKVINVLSHVALITDVTDETTVTDYHRYKISQKYYKDILKFRQPEEIKTPLSLYHLLDLECKNKLTKNPFPMRTLAVLEVDGEDVAEGVTDDITPYSMRVGFKEAVNLSVGQLVAIGLPKLQSESKKKQLQSMPYEVLSITGSGRFIALKAQRAKSGNMHPAEHFIASYSRDIAERVFAKRKHKPIPDLGEALKNLFVNLQHNFGAYFKRSGKYRLPAAITRPLNQGHLQNVFSYNVDGHQQHNLQNIFSLFSATKYESNFITKELQNFPYKNASEIRQGIAKELYITLQPNETSLKKIFSSRFGDSFESHEQKADFINKAQVNGEFYALLIVLTQTGAISWEALKLERIYVRKNAADSLTQFENELKRIVGMVEVVDITQEVLSRFE